MQPLFSVRLCMDIWWFFFNWECATMIIWVDNLYTLTSVRLFSVVFAIHTWGAFKENMSYNQEVFLVGDHFLYSCGLIVWFRGEIVERN